MPYNADLQKSSGPRWRYISTDRLEKWKRLFIWRKPFSRWSRILWSIREQPERLTIRWGMSLVCRHFVDRDMHKMSGLGMECHIDSSELLAARGFCRHWTESATCNTGDSFLTELTDIEGDVVDMEAYAQAFVCRAKEIPFISVKYVSDVIGQNSVKHWQDRLEDARAGLSHFFNVLKESIW